MNQATFLKTIPFAHVFSIDIIRLKKLIKSGQLRLNTHYIIPPFAKKRKYFEDILWDTENMRQWLKNENKTEFEIEPEVLSLLKRRGV